MPKQACRVAVPVKAYNMMASRPMYCLRHHIQPPLAANG